VVGAETSDVCEASARLGRIVCAICTEILTVVDSATSASCLIQEFNTGVRSKSP
jgi:hypothetical protein